MTSNSNGGMVDMANNNELPNDEHSDYSEPINKENSLVTMPMPNETPELQNNFESQSHGTDLHNLEINSTNGIELQAVSLPSEKDNKRKVQIWRKFAGILLSLLSALSFSIIPVIIKLLPHMHPITQTIWRQLANILITILMMSILKFLNISQTVVPLLNGILIEEENSSMPHHRIKWPKLNWIAIGKLSTFGAIVGSGMLFRVTALEYITIAEATVLTYLSLVFVLVGAHFILHETCLIIHTLMAVIIMVGAFIISRPPFLTGQEAFSMPLLIGIGMKLLDAFTTGFFSLFVRRFQQYHFATMTLTLNIAGIIVAIATAFAFSLFKLPVTFGEIGLLFLSGLLNCISQNSLALALQFDKAGIVSLIRCADVPFAFMWQIIIFHIVPDAWTMTGSGLVCIGVLVTSLTKLIMELPKDSAIRKLFGFMAK